jgi:valyl-tRNA synthetase
LVQQVTAAFIQYDYAAAKNAVEGFFWRDLSDNYVEMAKLRLYDPQHPAHSGARLALRQVLLTLVKLLAPLLPYVTETLYHALFAGDEGCSSVHRARWPQDSDFTYLQAEPESSEQVWAAQNPQALGEQLIAIATSVRRYKSANALSLGTELAVLFLACPDTARRAAYQAAAPDLSSVTRARAVLPVSALPDGCHLLPVEVPELQVGIVLSAA